MKALTITALCLTVTLLVISNIELKFQQYAITIIRSSEANEESNHNVSSKSILEDITKVILKDVAKQDNIGEDETVTSGFRMLDLKAMKTFDFAAGSELSVSVFANNILDEVARNHTSFVKNEVPLPGRNVGVRLKLNF